MLRTITQSWWMLLVRGILAILFGIAAFIWPGQTIEALVLLFGAYALADGIVAVIVGIQQYGETQRWWAVVLEGIAGIALGVLTLFWPGTTTTVLLAFIAAWAFMTGVLEIAAAAWLRKVIDGEWPLILAGALSVLFGVLLILQPTTGAVAIIWLIGAYAIVFGVLFSILAFDLRRLGQTIDRAVPGAV
jgi:uncharacterized membrane protein HdeD (DUF308 family)